MKINLIVGMLVMSFVFSYSNSFAQTSSAEKDSIECLKNFSLYSLSFKKKMYDYAMPAWRDMFENCPDVTIRIYSDGVDLYEHYLSQENDKAKKDALVDTIMMIYDQRIKYFGNHPKYPEGWIYGRKAVDLVRYRRNNTEALTEALQYFEKSYEMRQLKVEPLVALNWLQTCHALKKKEQLTDDEMLDVYIKVDEVIGNYWSKEQSENKKKVLAKISKTCGGILAESGFNDCGRLEASLSPRYESVKNDQEALNQLLHLMNKLECTDNPLFAKASEQNYNLKPGASAAYFLAKYYVKQNDFDKAITFYNNAIELEENSEAKAKYYYELALITFSYYKNGPKARDYANNAIKLETDWGKPHILIGNIYAMESKKYGSNEFEHLTVYWVALDRYKRAKNIDPECSSEADKQIALYSQYIPDKETGFFHGIEEGSKYKVASWINEETVVRYR